MKKFSLLMAWPWRHVRWSILVAAWTQRPCSSFFYWIKLPSFIVFVLSTIKLLNVWRPCQDSSKKSSQYVISTKHHYNTRLSAKECFSVIFSRTKNMKKSFTRIGVSISNSTPHSVKTLIRKKIKSLLLNVLDNEDIIWMSLI